VVVTDVAERFLSQLGDEVAEPVLIEEGTPLVGGESEAGRVGLTVNGGAEALTHLACDGIVVTESIGVHIDLPANTA
jgi:hypothetical protein